MSYPERGPADFLDLGNWNATCSMCGRKAKASWLVRNWQGQWRCPNHNEPRQPQDFVRARPDVVTPPWTQHAGDSYQLMCTPQGVSAVPGEAEPGCAYPGYLSPAYINAFFTP